jgi:hypothetical protein
VAMAQLHLATLVVCNSGLGAPPDGSADNVPETCTPS